MTHGLFLLVAGMMGLVVAAGWGIYLLLLSDLPGIVKLGLCSLALILLGLGFAEYDGRG